MSIIVIEGKRLDTAKAKHHFDIGFHDGSNRYHGDLYMSSKGTWYVYTPSQWSNGHRWELCDPADIIEAYGHHLDNDMIAEIAAAAKMETE